MGIDHLLHSVGRRKRPPHIAGSTSWHQRNTSMDLLTFPIENIDAATLEALISDKVAEGKLVDYKSALPGGSDSERTEFLADVSSFANTFGGYIFYGVIEDGGIPTNISGLPITDADAEINRLESMMRDGLDPRLPGVSCRAI